jgi:hypothetical protein
MAATKGSDDSAPQSEAGADPPGQDKDASDLERPESLVHWLEDLYTSNPNQAQFKKKLKLLADLEPPSQPLTGTEQDRLFEIASTSDSLLETTSRLLMALFKLRLSRPKDKSSGICIKEEIRELAIGVCKRHPLFETQGIADVFDNLESEHLSVSESRLVKKLWAYSSNAKTLTKSNCDKLKLNGLTCLLAEFKSNGLSNSEIHKLLRQSSWAKGEKFSADGMDAFFALVMVTAKEVGAPSVVAGLLEQTADESEKQAEIERKKRNLAERQKAEAVSESDRLRALLEIEQEKNTEALEERQQLEKELAEARSESRSIQIHLRDDYAKLHSQMIRGLNSDLTLLEEGQIALSRNPPKVDVMIDHADRTISRMKKQLRQLRESS